MYSCLYLQIHLRHQRSTGRISGIGPPEVAESLQEAGSGRLFGRRREAGFPSCFARRLQGRAWGLRGPTAAVHLAKLRG